MNDIGQTLSPWMFFRPREFPPLASSTRADVCVVGGGIAGVTTAYLLGRKGKRVMLLSATALGGGSTGRATAHLASAIDDRYYEIERLHGEVGARIAGESHAAAIEAIEAIVAQERIDCDFTRLDGYLFDPPGGDADVLVAELAAAQRAGVEGVEWAGAAPMPGFDTGRCLRFPMQGQLHPLKYLDGIARAFVRGGGRIHCGTHVARIEGGASPRAVTSEGHRVDCADLVVATNTPLETHGTPHAKQSPHVTYAIAARVPRDHLPRALFWDMQEPYRYARLDEPGGELLLVGGEGHEAGAAADAESRWMRLELWMRERFPAAREVLHRWQGQTMETADGLAYLGREPGEEHVYLVTGDSGMGMTHGTIGAILVTDLVHGARTAWAQLYDPSRKTPMRPVASYARVRNARNLPDLESGLPLRAESRWPRPSRTTPTAPGFL